MTYIFRTLLIPPAQEPIATAICNDLGYPEKGMFVSTMREDGDPPPIGQPDTRAILGYISSGAIPNDSPVLIYAAADMLDAILARNPDATVTLANCTEFINWLDRTEEPPFPRMDFMKGELNGIPAPANWHKPTASEPGYALDAVTQHAGVYWRNLVEGNREVPAFGRDGWRRVWG